jgi:glyoxylase-like metal-dependent hydrolase (beta-lactamase superfamily II)
MRVSLARPFPLGDTRALMQPVAEIQHVTSRLAVWQGFDPEVKTDLSSTAVATTPGLVIIDPVPLADDALAELVGHLPVAAVVLTNGNHERAAAEFAERFSAPVLAHADAKGEITIPVTRWLAEGDLVADALRVIALPGAGAGEIALHDEAAGLLCIGDALVNLDATGFTFLPEKYCADAKLLRASVKKLRGLTVQAVTFAHGLPVVQDAAKKLEALIS